MKRFMLFLMCGMLLLTIVGCGTQPKTPTNTENSITDTKEETNMQDNLSESENDIEISTDDKEEFETETDTDTGTVEQDGTTANDNAGVDTEPERTTNKTNTETGSVINKETTKQNVEPDVKSETKTDTSETKPEVKTETDAKPVINNIHSPTDIELEVLKYLNIEREKAGLNKLTYNGSIYDCGVIRANECLVKWSHTRPNGSKYWTVFDECNKPITTCCGENLAKTFTNAEQIVEMLMNSDGHRANILHKDFVSVCITVLKDENGYYYMSQLFMGK